MMGVVYSFFQIIISFLTDILFNISFINHLFVADLDKKNLVFKSVKKYKWEFWAKRKRKNKRI